MSLPSPQVDGVVAVAGADDGGDGQAAGELEVVVAAEADRVNAGDSGEGLVVDVDAIELAIYVDACAAGLARADRRDVELVVGVAAHEVESIALDRGAGGEKEIRQVIRLRRVDAWRHVVVIAGIGGLCSVGIAGGNEAVQIWGCGIAKELLWRPGGYVRWLREVVVLHLNVTDIANGRVER